MYLILKTNVVNQSYIAAKNCNASPLFTLFCPFAYMLKRFTVNYFNDTPGLGSKVADPEFANSIIGSKVGDKVDTIAGSTVSSAAVVKGIDAAAAVYQSLK